MLEYIKDDEKWSVLSFMKQEVLRKNFIIGYINAGSNPTLFDKFVLETRFLI